MSAILVTGGHGQIGRAVAALAWPGPVTVLAPGRAELDLTDPGQVAAWFAAHPVAGIVNCAAFTAVDRAEEEVGAAFAANAYAPALLAEQARRSGVPIVQISTDYVFDGTAAGYYPEDAAVAPIGVYGASKLAGEYAVLRGAPRAAVLRTAWVFSAHRHNFLKTMLRLAGERDTIRVVDDQLGCPTSADDIARAVQAITLRMMADARAPAGIFHFVNAGEASWYDLARAILARSAVLGGPSAQVLPTTTADFPTPARRPANSRLSTGRLQAEYGIVPRPWQAAMEDVLDALSVRQFAEAASA